MKIIEEKTIPNFEVKKILENFKDEELIFDQKITKDFLNKYYDIDEKIYAEVKKNLQERGFPEHIVSMILNVLPEYEEQLVAIFAKERNKPSAEDIKFILDEIAKIIK